jgi:hypothetical protein
MTDPISCHLPQGAKARSTVLVTNEIVFKDWISHACQRLLRYFQFSQILSQKPVGPMLPSSDKKCRDFNLKANFHWSKKVLDSMIPPLLALAQC